MGKHLEEIIFNRKICTKFLCDSSSFPIGLLAGFYYSYSSILLSSNMFFKLLKDYSRAAEKYAYSKICPLP